MTALASPHNASITTAAIELEQVYKRFGETAVVKNLSLAIAKGEMFGLLGPNGAGKSTTVRMLTTLTAPSDGTVQVMGHNVTNDPVAVRQSIGVVLQQISLDNDLTAWENLEFHGRMHHMPRRDREARISQWLGYVQLSDRRDAKVRTLSGGMKRRLQIARALLHEPQVLFLDEPTVGLDPQARRLLWDIIRDLNQQGMTILLTTHYMEEAESLCQRVGIMNQGELLRVAPPKALLEEFGEAMVVRYPIDREGKPDYHFCRDMTAANHYVDSQTDRTGLMVRPSNLEDVFVSLTGTILD